MTTEHKDACCGGHGSEKKATCCGGARNWMTAAAIAVAVAAVVYAASGRSESNAPVKLSAEQVSSLIQGDDTVVAKLNGRKIYKSEVAAAIRELGANVPPENVDQVLPAFIDQYVNLQLINQAAKEAGIAKDETVASQIANSREQIIRAAYMRGLFDGAVSEEALQQAYSLRYESQPMPTEVHARHILVNDEAQARDIIARLQAGGDFAKLAEEFSKDPTASRGGDLGYFVQAEMVPEFGEAVFSMNKGQLSSEPVKTQFGFHVVKIEDKRQRVKPAFEDARQALDQEARQAVLDAKLAELREKAKVELVEAKVDAAVEGAPVAPTAEVPAADAPVAPAAE